MHAKLVAVLAVLILGVGTWWILSGGGGGAPDLGHRASSTNDGAAAAQGDEAMGFAQGGVAGAARDGSAAAAAAADNVTGRREAVGPAAGDAAIAPLQLTGRLVDRAGEPVVGATLRWSTWEVGRAIGDLTDSSFGAADGAEVESDREGRFRFAVAPGSSGRVALHDDERVLRAGALVFRSLSADRDFGDVELFLASTIQGQVTDARGVAIAGVRVSAAGDGVGLGSASTATTDSDGRFEVGRLHPGSWFLRTASGQHLPAAVEIQVGPEDHVRDVMITLEAGQAIAGRVVDDRGLPVAGIKVGSRRKEERVGMQIERFVPEEATRTDDNGMFTLAGLNEDRVTVFAFGAGYSTASERDVLIGASNVLLRVHRLGSISGVLLDIAGTPIAGSRVVAESRGGGAALPGALGIGPMAFSTDHVATTADDGSFRIDDVAPGITVVEATGPRHRPARSQPVNVQPAVAVEDVVLRADRGASVVATVVDDQGEPVAGAEVEVREPRGAAQHGVMMRRVEARSGPGESGPVGMFDPAAAGRGETGADGVAEIHGLAAGAAVIHVRHASFAAAVPEHVMLPATGVVQVTLALRTPGYAAVRVLGDDGEGVAARILLRGPLGGTDAPGTHGARSDAKGDARVGPLVAGDYEALVELEPKPQSMAGGMVFMGMEGRPVPSTRVAFVVVAGGTSDVVLRMPVLARLSGRVTDADGPVAGVDVEVQKVDDDALANLGGGGVPSHETPGTKTDEDGRYQLAELVAGKYELRWGKPTQLIKASTPLLIPTGERDVQRDLELRYGKLQVRVTDGDGEPLEGAAVELQRGDAASGGPRRGQRMMAISISTTSDGDGGGEVTSMTMGGGPRAKTGIEGVATLEDVPPGTYTVVVSRTGYVTAKAEQQAVTEGGSTDAGTVVLSASGGIRGTVVDPAGGSVGMALVRCRPLDGGEAPPPQPAMGGSFAFESLAPGRYALTAGAIGPDSGPDGPEQEVVVERGNAQRVQLVVGERR